MSVVRPPEITEDDLGPEGWRAFHELSAQRRRKPRESVIPLVQYAVARWMAGEEVEVSRSQLEALFGTNTQLESVA
jgi:NOL1/NOP2/fmu family ribosome biogenesis protein